MNLNAEFYVNDSSAMFINSSFGMGQDFAQSGKNGPSIFPVTSTDVELRNLASWQANRRSLEELLQLRAGALDNLRASVTILAPLASGAVSVLLGDKLLLGTK